MLVLPAIDLKEGKCVRLYQGEMETAKVYSDSPEATALKWQSMGAKMLHVVDLDGAMAGEPRNLGAISRILQVIDIPIELGGGIRNEKIVEDYLQLGVSKVILGTAAYRDSEMVRRVCGRFPERIAVGIDARGGYVAVQGWKEVTEVRAIDLAEEFEDAGANHIIYTDISRDGALSGPNIGATERLAQAISIPVVLSGGMHHYNDLEAAAGLERVGVKAVILGRSIYEGTIDLARAVRDIQNEGDSL
jgi:phosphoribosylformimino-5-aminoimidazole carboxamide ribotide isomerase